MAKRFRKLTAAERQAARKAITAKLAEELPKQGMKRAVTRWRQRRAESDRFIDKMHAKWQAEGGEEGTGKPFIDWLISLNWPAIIAFIMTLFA